MRASRQHSQSACIGACMDIPMPSWIAEDDSAAGIGTTVHQAIAEYIAYGCTEALIGATDEAKQLYYNAVRLWEDGPDDGPGLKEWFGDFAKVEERYDDPWCPGTADLARYRSGMVYIADWKTGRVHGDHWAQVATYARHEAVRQEEGGKEVKSAVVFIARPRECDYEYRVYSRTDLEEMYQATVANAMVAKDADPHDLSNYTTGPHCLFCWRQNNCPAQRLALYSWKDAMDGSLELDLSTMSDEQITNIYSSLKVWERISKDALDGIKEEIKARGPIEMGGGNFLQVQEVNRREVDTAAAIPILESELPTNRIIEALSLSVSGIENAAKEHVREMHNGKPPRGSIKTAIQQLTDKLETAGAITREPSQQLVMKPLKEIEA